MDMLLDERGSTAYDWAQELTGTPRVTCSVDDVYFTKDGGEIVTVGDAFAVLHDTPEDAASREECVRLVRWAIANALNERERTVVLLRFNGYGLEDIGEKMKLSRERVRQIEGEAMYKVAIWICVRTRKAPHGLQPPDEYYYKPPLKSMFNRVTRQFGGADGQQQSEGQTRRVRGSDLLETLRGGSITNGLLTGWLKRIAGSDDESGIR